MCKDFTPNFGDKRPDCFITTTHRLTLRFSPGNFLPKTTWLSSSTDLTFLFPRFNIKLKGRHFYTIEVIEAESRVIEHDFQDSCHLKNDRIAGNGAYAQKGCTSRVMVASTLKVSFWPDGSISTGNCWWFFVSIKLHYGLLALKTSLKKSWVPVLNLLPIVRSQPQRQSKGVPLPEGGFVNTRHGTGKWWALKRRLHYTSRSTERTQWPTSLWFYTHRKEKTLSTILLLLRVYSLPWARLWRAVA
jgi:hypothetical protein